MGTILIIKGADFSQVSVDVITPSGNGPVINISATGIVTIVDANATKIFYTTDGSTPTTSSTAYASEFSVKDGTTVSAISTYESGATSKVVSKKYSGGGSSVEYVTFVGKGYDGSNAGIIDVASRAIYMAKVSEANPVCSIKSYTTGGVTYSAIYIPTTATKVKYSVNSGFSAIGGVCNGSDYASIFEPSEGWTQSNEYDVSSYRGMWIVLSARNASSPTDDISSKTAEEIGFSCSFE